MKKQKYILGLVGSPRKGGNTDIIVGEVLKTASELGARTEVVYLGESDIAACRGCGHCRPTGICRQKDGMRSVMTKLHAADGIVLGTPVYFGTATAQMMAFVNRLYALLTPKFETRIKGTRRCGRDGQRGDRRGLCPETEAGDG
jgi:multimeric flavodoxin WrbA